METTLSPYLYGYGCPWTFRDRYALLWSDTFRNEAHFNYLINMIFSSTQFPYS